MQKYLCPDSFSRWTVQCIEMIIMQKRNWHTNCECDSTSILPGDEGFITTLYWHIWNLDLRIHDYDGVTNEQSGDGCRSRTWGTKPDLRGPTSIANPTEFAIRGIQGMPVRPTIIVNVGSIVINDFFAFILACSYGHQDIVELLLDYSDKIEVNAADNTGWTTFTSACKNVFFL